MGENKRRPIRSIFVKTNAQVKFSVLVMAISVLFVICFSTIFVLTVDSHHGLLAQVSADGVDQISVDALSLINESLLLLGVLAAFLISMFILVVERTHRIFGPIVAVRRFLEEIEKGDYSARIRIRKNDDFHDLAEKLNDLAEKLEARYPASQVTEKGSN